MPVVISSFFSVTNKKAKQLWIPTMCSIICFMKARLIFIQLKIHSSEMLPLDLSTILDRYNLTICFCPKCLSAQMTYYQYGFFDRFKLSETTVFMSKYNKFVKISQLSGYE